jgi:hypothetical protein
MDGAQVAAQRLATIFANEEVHDAFEPFLDGQLAAASTSRTTLAQLGADRLALFRQALVHPSLPQEADLPPGCNYQVLEHLGDALHKAALVVVVHARLPGQNEGFYTGVVAQLASNASLGALAVARGFRRVLRVGGSREPERADAGAPPTVALVGMLAGAFEAFVGALYLTVAGRAGGGAAALLPAPPAGAVAAAQLAPLQADAPLDGAAFACVLAYVAATTSEAALLDAVERAARDQAAPQP